MDKKLTRINLGINIVSYDRIAIIVSVRMVPIYVYDHKYIYILVPTTLDFFQAKGLYTYKAGLRESKKAIAQGHSKQFSEIFL